MLRQQKHLRAISKKYPKAWQRIDIFRAGRGKDLPDWPEWCFLPMAGAYAIINDGDDILNPAQIADISRLAALAAWRVTQGIYRFDSDLYQEIKSTPVKGKLPIEILFRMPEWCVYIETPDMKSIAGFYAHLEWDVNNHRIELRFLIDDEKIGLYPVPLHLSPGCTLEKSIVDMHAYTMSQADKVIKNILDMDNLPQHIANLIEPCLSLLVYLCSVNSDLRASDGRNILPQKPSPKKTKKGVRLFPPQKPTIWETGFRMGAALRTIRNQAKASASRNTEVRKERRSPIPHIRRAHWHSYWRGPRKEPEKRKLIVKWMPPIPVGFSMEEVERLVLTVKEVKK